MTDTVENKGVIAYKGMDFYMTCRDFQYDIGKSYKVDNVVLCRSGFHACLNPADVLDYYFQREGSRYFKVKLSGRIVECDNMYSTKIAATEITILEEIDINKAIESDEWWKNDGVTDYLYYRNGLAKVRRGKKGEDIRSNYIDRDGKLLYDKWFRTLESFSDGFAVVQGEDDLWNYIDKRGNYLCDQWFSYACKFIEGFAVVQRKEEDKVTYNVIDLHGNYVFDQWYHWVSYPHKGYSTVQRDDELWNFIDLNSKLISDRWFDNVSLPGDDMIVCLGNNWYKIDESGNMYFYKKVEEKIW